MYTCFQVFILFCLIITFHLPRDIKSNKEEKTTFDLISIACVFVYPLIFNLYNLFYKRDITRCLVILPFPCQIKIVTLCNMVKHILYRTLSKIQTRKIYRRLFIILVYPVKECRQSCKFVVTKLLSCQTP